MKTKLQPAKFTYRAPLTAIAVSAMLLMGGASGANAWHKGHAHVLSNALGGALGGALIGGAIKGKKGAATGAAIGAAVGIAASGSGRRAAPPPPPPTYYPPAPVQGSALVYDIQGSLARLGYNPGPIDGVYGRRTADAISAYEYNNQLPVTGQPSDPLRYHLKQAGG